MKAARLLIAPIALVIAVVATSPAGAAPQAPRLVSQLKDGSEYSSVSGCPAKRSGSALRVSCRSGRSAVVRYSFRISGTVHGKVASTVSSSGSVRRSITMSRGTATVSLKVSGVAVVKSVSITYYAS